MLNLALIADEVRPQERQQERLVTYHAVDPVKSSSTYNVSCSRFEEHLRMIIDLEKSDRLPVGWIGITFDDGHASNFEHAAPLLEEYRRNAIFFVVASFINARPDFMTWEQLRELSGKGHAIQSHSWSHPLLTHCTDQELDDELVRSRRVIEDKLATTVDSLGVPGGRWDRRVLRAAARAGYRKVYVSDPLLTQEVVERVYLYGRLTVKDTMPTAKLRSVLAARGFQALDFYMRYRAKEAFRKLVGDKTYRRVWAALGDSKGEKTVRLVKNTAQKGLKGQA
jgi:hypothetical protein